MTEKQVLWEGILTEHVIELGPSGSFALDGQLRFTCWTKDAEMLLQKQYGKKVRIILEQENSSVTSE